MLQEYRSVLHLRLLVLQDGVLVHHEVLPLVVLFLQLFLLGNSSLESLQIVLLLINHSLLHMIWSEPAKLDSEQVDFHKVP